MTYTKSLSKCQLLFQEYKEARLNAGVPLLKQFETDNVKSDRRFIEHHFPELKEGVVPNNKGPDGCMKATISEEQYVFINTCTAANNWAGSIINSDLLVNSPKEVLVGLDAEWNKGDTGIRLLQLSFPDHLVAVFDLQQMEVYDEPRRPFPNMLKQLLHLKCIVACGSQVGGDCGQLEQIQVNIDHHLDLKQAAIQHDSEQPHGTGLQGLSRRYLQLHIDKFGQHEDWSIRPLESGGDLIKYAALDALLSRKLGEELVCLLLQRPGGMIETPAGLRVGQKVDLFLAGKVATSGTVEFIGFAGQQKQWGTITIGKGKALLKVDDVFIRGSKLPFSFNAQGTPEEPKSLSWDKKKKTIGDIFKESNGDCVVAVRSSSLITKLELGDESSGAMAGTPSSSKSGHSGVALGRLAAGEAVGSSSANSAGTASGSASTQQVLESVPAPIPALVPASVPESVLAPVLVPELGPASVPALVPASVPASGPASGPESGPVSGQSLWASCAGSGSGVNSAGVDADSGTQQEGRPQHEQDYWSVEDILACEEIDWVVDEVREAAESPSRSRSKYDLWHQFHDLPMPKSCPK
jgi:hypothetical protein